MWADVGRCGEMSHLDAMAISFVTNRLNHRVDEREGPARVVRLDRTKERLTLVPYLRS